MSFDPDKLDGLITLMEDLETADAVELLCYGVAGIIAAYPSETHPEALAASYSMIARNVLRFIQSGSEERVHADMLKGGGPNPNSPWGWDQRKQGS